MSWGGIGVRRGTPREIIERLAHEINAGLADPVVRKRLNDVAATPIFYTRAQFSAFMNFAMRSATTTDARAPVETCRSGGRHGYC
jgi:tripartite-type tricarboxylate transporter receptor subunit TctC